VGAKARRKKEFLAEHLYCCFCGGTRLAEEPDHVPPRVLFDGRRWPEGFEFPACVRCNRATRHDEQIVAMLVRLYPDATTPAGMAEVDERFRAVAHNYPEVLAEMRPTAEQIQSAVEKYKIQLEAGQSIADLPVLSVKGPIVNRAIENFARKLFCALFYKHLGTALPSEGGIAVTWYSNIQIFNEEIPRSIADVLVGFPDTIERARTNLGNQFFYRWGINPNKEAAGFLAFFREAFALIGYLMIDADRFTLRPGVNILRPYQWDGG
jgi:hypothetical protein